MCVHTKAHLYISYLDPVSHLTCRPSKLVVSTSERFWLDMGRWLSERKAENLSSSPGPCKMPGVVVQGCNPLNKRTPAFLWESCSNQLEIKWQESETLL